MYESQQDTDIEQEWWLRNDIIFPFFRVDIGAGKCFCAVEQYASVCVKQCDRDTGGKQNCQYSLLHD